MGRSSIAPQRKKEIIDAFERCIEQYGFNGSSTRLIAAEAKMKQSMIAHYFGNKQVMVDTLVRQIIDDYVSRMQKTLGKTTGDTRVQKMIDFLFGPGLLGNKTKRNLIGHLLAATFKDEKLRGKMRFMYQSFLEMGVNELHRAMPDISKCQCMECVYGILCLAVGNDAVLSVDLPYTNRKLAKQCAEALVYNLRK